jgi:hypothetical protein
MRVHSETWSEKEHSDPGPPLENPPRAFGMYQTHLNSGEFICILNGFPTDPRNELPNEARTDPTIPADIAPRPPT